MFLKINPENPNPRKIKQVVAALEKGKLIIYPTDTVYGLACDIFNQKAIKDLCRLRKIDPAKALLTMICSDLSQLAEYAHQLDKETFKLLKRNLPGPFTFILKANKKSLKAFKNKRKTLGMRIPNNNIALHIVEHLGRPIFSISLKQEDETQYYTDPYDIDQHFSRHEVAIVIDGGIATGDPSAIIDCTVEEPEIIRSGVEELRF